MQVQLQDVDAGRYEHTGLIPRVPDKVLLTGGTSPGDAPDHPPRQLYDAQAQGSLFDQIQYIESYLQFVVLSIAIWREHARTDVDVDKKFRIQRQTYNVGVRRGAIRCVAGVDSLTHGHVTAAIFEEDIKACTLQIDLCIETQFQQFIALHTAWQGNTKPVVSRLG